MTHVDLTDAVFIDARAVRVNFNDATLDGVNFNGAAIADSTFGNASLIGATFVNATAGNSSGGAEFLSANLTNANFTGANLAAYNSNPSNFIRFDGSNLYNADFRNAIWATTAQYITSLANANLTCAHMDAPVTSKQVTWTNATCPDGTLANATTGCTGKLTRGASCP